MRMQRHSVGSTLVCAALILGACGGTWDEAPAGEGELQENLGEMESQAKALTFELFEDPNGIGTQGQAETRRVFTTAQAYQSYFGHAAPSTVNFTGGDAVLFYSAGVKNTGGYDAQVTALSRSNSGKTLYITTQLVSPGKGCAVTQAFTKPYVLAKLPLPKSARYAAWFKDDVTRDCTEEEPPYNPCALVRCAAGTACVVKQIQCITTPCNPVAECVPVPQGPFCGGFANFPCPGAGSCEDDPTDDCDPTQGGADCGGRCDCKTQGSCTAGEVWNSSPDVCGCEKKASPPPSGGVKCGKNTCAQGQVCCNASCGICTPPNGACIQLACSQ